MPLIMSSSIKDVSVQVQGNWFTFKPKQIKQMDENKVFFLTSKCAYLGFIAVPDKFEDIEARSTPEGKAELAAIEAQGIKNRVEFLTYLKNNELRSLRSDLERKNDKSDPRAYMSAAMVDQLEELSKYTKKLETAKTEQLNRIKQLEKELEG